MSGIWDMRTDGAELPTDRESRAIRALYRENPTAGPFELSNRMKQRHGIILTPASITLWYKLGGAK